MNIISGFAIGERKIGIQFQPYIIAEAGINHNGILENALKMVEVAKLAGADAVKFQTFKAHEFCGDPNQIFSYTSRGKKMTEPMLDMFNRFELKNEDWKQIKVRCISLDIEFLSTPQNESDLSLLVNLGVNAVKIGSDDLNNYPLISAYSKYGLPIILSSGMSDFSEVEKALDFSGYHKGNKVALLICTSQYPTPAHDVNISRLQKIKEFFPELVVGFSDHTIGNEAANMAVALNASIFEKHFTLSHDLEGPDHWFSLNPNQLKNWVLSIRNCFAMKGSGVFEPTQEELKMRILARRSITATEDINPDEVMSDLNIGLRRPGNGLAPEHLTNVIGKRSTRYIKKGSLVYWEDLS